MVDTKLNNLDQHISTILTNEAIQAAVQVFQLQYFSIINLVTLNRGQSINCMPLPLNFLDINFFSELLSLTCPFNDTDVNFLVP